VLYRGSAVMLKCDVELLFTPVETWFSVDVCECFNYPQVLQITDQSQII